MTTSGGYSNTQLVQEEAYLTLLQRIQRQYGAPGSGGGTSTPPPPRPPDEAAYALGKGLALAFVGLASPPPSSPATSSPSDDIHRNVVSGAVPKSIQEKTLMGMSDRHVNPSVCRAFFDTLIQLHRDPHPPPGRSRGDARGGGGPVNRGASPAIHIGMEVWLPSWILFTEQAGLDGDGDDDDRAGPFDPLTCMIRAYAQHVQILSLRDSRRLGEVGRPAGEATTAAGGGGADRPPRRLRPRPQPHPSTRHQPQPPHDPRTLSHPTSYVGTVGRTYAKLQTQAGRLAMLREFTGLAFDEPSTGNYRLMLTPLMTCSVLSQAASSASSMTEAMLCMEGIWRETYVLVFEGVDDGRGGGHDDGIYEIDHDNHDGANEDGGRDGGRVREGDDAVGQTDDAARLRPSSSALTPPPPPYMIGIVQWLTETLDLYLLTIPSRNADARIACKELAHRWLAMVLDLGAFVSQAVEATGGRSGGTSANGDPVDPDIDTEVGTVNDGAVAPENVPPDVRGEDKIDEDGADDNSKEDGEEAKLAKNVEALIPELIDSQSDPHVMRMKEEQSLQLGRWFEGIVSGTLIRWFALVPSYRISMEILAVPLQSLTDSYVPERPFSLMTILRLATLAMSDPKKDDVREILSMLATSVDEQSQQRIHPAAFTMLRGLGSIFLRDEVCATTTRNLLQNLSRKKRIKTPTPLSITSNSNNPEDATTSKDPILANLIQLSEEHPAILESLIQFASSNGFCHDASHSFSVMQQVACLVFGIGLLDTVRYRQFAYAFLKNLLRAYPHLGITLLPVLVDSINAAAIHGEGSYMIEQIIFLCEVVVRDTQCAREVWNLLGVELMGESIPIVIRSSIIRLFPKICVTNKRLYKRVIDSMAAILAKTAEDKLETGNLELRLAVAASIADLAREDHIRDPTDVIGWIQSFITDSGWVRPVSTLDRKNANGSAALAHYAILSLHYLVVAQELDFSLVLVVLSKRLCTVHDMSEVSKLPPIVLESLILLLGDGELDGGESENEEDQPRAIGSSPQASRSVETLINLWNSDSLKPGPSSTIDQMDMTTLLRCRRNIYESLSKYSFEALGVDEDGIRAVVDAAASKEQGTHSKIPQNGSRYRALKCLVEDGIAILEMVESKEEISSSLGEAYKEVGRSTDSDISDALSILVSKIIKFEEDSLGSNLWQKRSNLKRKGPKKQHGRSLQMPFNSLQPKPLPSPARILKAYNENKCQATSVAALLSFDGKSMSLLTDLASDATSDPSDPLLETFYVQAWLNATRSVLIDMVASLSSSELLDKLLLDIQEWRLDTPDAMYMCLSCLALHIPEILGPYGDHSTYVKDIADDICEAYKGHVFEDPNVARLCLGFVGVCDFHLGNEERLTETVHSLEKTVTGYGGQPSFGSYFGLAVIAQACAGLVNVDDDSEAQSYSIALISRILSFLINELAKCIKGSHSALESLIACIKRREMNPEVIDALTALKKKSMKVTASKKQAATSIFIAFAICLPSLTKVNEELLLGVFCLFESLEWGCGKGIALPSVLRACRLSGIFESIEIDKMYAKYAKVFEEAMEQGVDGLWDIFYAVTSIQSKTIPYSIRKFMVGNRNLFDENGRAVSLVSAVHSLSSIPCLGDGKFCDATQLSHTALDADISGVVESLLEGAKSVEWNNYSQMATILLGFMASLGFTEAIDHDGSLRLDDRMMHEEQGDSPLPVPAPGTALELVMSALQMHFQDSHSVQFENQNPGIVKLLGCLKVLSLPGHFADFLEQLMRKGDDAIKSACATLVVSQLQGRPRAVFDGHEYANLAAKISKLPATSLRGILGEDKAAEIFVGSFGEMLSKFPTQSVEEASENMFRYCINMIGHNSALTVRFLLSMKDLMHRAKDAKFVKFSPKAQHTIKLFLLRRGFAGIRNASWSAATVGPTEQRTIIETYASCLLEIPTDLLLEADFFTVKDLDGFFGESLRIRVIMVLVQNDYFSSATQSYGEIASSIAWICRQLVACDDEIFSATILHVACAIAKASARESAIKKKELLIALLDNLLLVSADASFVGLQMLAALVFQWCHGRGSDGDLSLLVALGTSVDRWQDMPTQLLHQAFRIAVHDFPFNLAKYVRREKLSGVVFNRLWRIYVKWWEQGADEQTLFHLRRAVVCCRDVDSGGIEDMITLTTSIVLEA